MKTITNICLLTILLFAIAAYGNISADLSAGAFSPMSDDSANNGMLFSSDIWHPLWKKFSVGAGGKFFLFDKQDAHSTDFTLNLRYTANIHRRWAIDIVSAGGINFYNGEYSPALSPAADLRFFISPRWQIGCSANWKHTFDTSQTKDVFSTSLLIEYMFGFHDSDGDWVPDKIDRCNKTPYGARVNNKGCALDSDGDGVFDGFDRCPNTPKAALVDSLGCPTDSDGDGVFDGVDRCPETPTDIPIDTTGCPRDSDRDGVPDYADSCAKTPEGAIVDHNGCSTDSDEDGVPDGIDQCNGTPTGFDVDLFGCPKIPSVNGEIIYNLFDSNLQLTASALNQLHRVAKRIRAYPDRTVVIEIHTDTEGSPTYNKNRASSVGKKIVEFLKEQGIDSDIIKISPAGEKDPIIKKGTVEAKRKNRRAIFSVEEP